MEQFFFDLLIVLWFFIPAGVANVVPIIASKMPLIRRFDYPLDSYMSFRGYRILGDHKTWRGIIVGVLAGIVSALILALGQSCDAMFSLCNFDKTISTITVGLLLSFGALAGDALKSFFKRQMNIGSGKPWYVFDQIDYIIGASLCTFWLVPLPWYDYFLGMFIWGGISLLMSYIGFLTRFKKSPI